MSITDINPLALPFVPLEERSQLPATPAIYFAIDMAGTIRYIGRSTNPQQRWLQHHRYGDLSRIGGIRIAWLNVSSPDLLPEIEKALIKWFRPPLNRVAALEPQTARVGVVMPKKTRERLEVMAKVKGWSISQTATILIEEGLDRLEGKEE